MERSETHMTYNGADYRLIKRSKKVVLYSVNNGRRYKVCWIYVRPAGLSTHLFLYRYPEQEIISANGQFSHDGSKFFFKLEDAEWYFEKLNRELDEKDKNNVPIGQN